MSSVPFDFTAEGRVKSVNAFTFLKHYVSKPGEVGSIAPSSSTLANVMTAKAGVSSASSVLELGPGTGAITRCI